MMTDGLKEIVRLLSPTVVKKNDRDYHTEVLSMEKYKSGF